MTRERNIYSIIGVFLMLKMCSLEDVINRHYIEMRIFSSRPISTQSVSGLYIVKIILAISSSFRLTLRL